MMTRAFAIYMIFPLPSPFPRPTPSRMKGGRIRSGDRGKGRGLKGFANKLHYNIPFNIILMGSSQLAVRENMGV